MRYVLLISGRSSNSRRPWAQCKAAVQPIDWLSPTSASRGCSVRRPSPPANLIRLLICCSKSMDVVVTATPPLFR